MVKYRSYLYFNFFLKTGDTYSILNVRKMFTNNYRKIIQQDAQYAEQTASQAAPHIFFESQPKM